MDESLENLNLPQNPARVLSFIRGYHLLRDHPPSAGEVASGLGLVPKLARYYLLFLERGGYIRCQRGLARGIALMPLGISVRIPGETPATHRPLPGTPDGKVLRVLEQVFPYGNGESCDICGRHPKADADRFCPNCREWLAAFVQSRPAGSAASLTLDMAQCLAMMLRYEQRPNGGKESPVIH